MQTARTLTRVLLLLLLGLTAQRLMGTETGTLPILLVGMAPVVLLPAYPALVWGAVSRDRTAAGMATAVVIAHLAICLPRLQAQPISEAARSAPTIRVGTANLYVMNPDAEQAGARLRTLDLDVLVVPELSDAGLAALRASGLTDDLPYASVTEGTGPETTGLLSRLPISDVRNEVFSGRGQPEVTVTVAGQQVRVVGFHAQPAISVFEHPWRAGFGEVREMVGRTDLPTVVMGDLNASLDNGDLRRLLRRTDLGDAHAERGRGLVRTWPAGLPLTAYDHVLVRDGDRARVEVLDVHEERIPGSDHLAVVSTVAIVGDTGR